MSYITPKQAAKILGVHVSSLKRSHPTLSHTWDASGNWELGIGNWELEIYPFPIAPNPHAWAGEFPIPLHRPSVVPPTHRAWSGQLQTIFCENQKENSKRAEPLVDRKCSELERFSEVKCCT